MKRRFEVVSKYQSVALPKRATNTSAGYDLAAIEDTLIEAGQMAMVSTGVKAIFPANEVLYVFARSSLSVNYGLMLPNGVGVIDSDYYNNPRNEGEIFVLLYNFTDYPVIIIKGERIAQAIFSFYFTVIDERTPTQSRFGGFGSTS
jgi:dUTP pyrophosphatase